MSPELWDPSAGSRWGLAAAGGSAACLPPSATSECQTKSGWTAVGVPTLSRGEIGACPRCAQRLARKAGSAMASCPFRIGGAGDSGRGAFVERALGAGETVWVEGAAVAVLDDSSGLGRCVACVAPCPEEAAGLACPQCAFRFCSDSCSQSNLHASSGECAVLTRASERGKLGCTSDERCALRLLHAWCA